MDYIEQVEKVFNYLKFNLEFDELEKLLNFKKNFNNDLNLIGCFLKDYLILHSIRKNFSNEELYNTFVLYFEENINNKKQILNKIIKFSKYYIMLVFENCDDIEILTSISTINACYCLECYPLVMKIFDKYFENRIERCVLIKKLHNISNLVLEKFENPNSNIDFYNLSEDNNKAVYPIDKIHERAVV